MSGDSLMNGASMNTMVTALTTGDNALTGTTLWTNVGYLVPLITILFVFVFGWTKLAALIRGGAKGKLKLK